MIVAAVIRTIDALKSFDTIYVITQGGPGTASETINLYLYLQAFAFYNIGNALGGRRRVLRRHPRAGARCCSRAPADEMDG